MPQSPRNRFLTTNTLKWSVEGVVQRNTVPYPHSQVPTELATATLDLRYFSLAYPLILLYLSAVLANKQ